MAFVLRSIFMCLQCNEYFCNWCMNLCTKYISTKSTLNHVSSSLNSSNLKAKRMHSDQIRMRFFNALKSFTQINVIQTYTQTPSQTNIWDKMNISLKVIKFFIENNHNTKNRFNEILWHSNKHNGFADQISNYKVISSFFFLHNKNNY